MSVMKVGKSLVFDSDYVVRFEADEIGDTRYGSRTHNVTVFVEAANGDRTAIELRLDGATALGRFMSFVGGDDDDLTAFGKALLAASHAAAYNHDQYKELQAEEQEEQRAQKEAEAEAEAARRAEQLA